MNRISVSPSHGNGVALVITLVFLSVTIFNTGVYQGAYAALGAAVLYGAWLAYGRYAMRRLEDRMCDEVLDTGDALVVRKGKESDRIPMAHIESVEPPGEDQPAVTLHLRTPCRFGGEILFQPRPNGFSIAPRENEVVRMLTRRVDNRKGRSS